MEDNNPQPPPTKMEDGKSLPLPFDTLPNIINQMIGSHLDYDSRMNFSRVLTSVDDKYVNKIDSDAHNLSVKANLLRDKLSRFEAQPLYSIQRIKIMKEMFLYLLHTKDTCLFTKTGKDLRRVMIDRAILFSDEQAYGVQLYYRYRRECRSLMNVAAKLFSYLDSLPPPKDEYDNCAILHIR